ncbi:hypothetical protein [Butyrivibrio sp. NC2002]|uniref:hypothetical protein n=1 Tax=Butyrivibrio sp. NC2002 TaxID=1410610 RepID=UPI00056A40E3|nr:hypothetical protein [Butyrivibrio sp. NC2002]
MSQNRDNKNNIIDNGIFFLIDNHLDKIAAAILVIVAVAIRIMLMPQTSLSPDYESYYLPWVLEYKRLGIIGGLSTTIGDYYVPFNVMYAICSLFDCEPYIPLTIFSMIAEFITAFYVGKIINVILKENGKEDRKAQLLSLYVPILTLYLPFVVWNGSLWKQCDAIYVVFLVIALYKLLSEEYRWAFVFLAISFGFKLQAIFFIPLFLIIYMVKRKFSILEFFWIPVIYFVLGLPCVLLHRGLRATYFAYLSQTQEVSTEGYGLVSYYPNFYNFGLDNFDEVLKTPGLLLFAAVMVFLAVFVYKHKGFLKTKENILYLAVFSSWTCCMILPGMHERYDYAVVLLATALFVAIIRKNMWAAFVMNFNSMLVYIIVLFGQKEVSMVFVSILEIAAFVIITIDFIRRVSKYDA